MRIPLSVLTALLCCGCLLTPTGSITANPRAFHDSFDDRPFNSPFPLPAGGPNSPRNWDVAIHSQSPKTWDELPTMHAHHSSDCAPPLETHKVSSYEDSVYICRNHLMTSLEGEPYAAAYLTPAALLDLSDGTARVRMRLSSYRLSGGDWVDLWITPFDETLQLPADEDTLDLQGYPANAIHVKQGLGPLADTWDIYLIRNFERELIATLAPSAPPFTRNASRRDSYELLIENDTITWSVLEYGLSASGTIAPLNWEGASVQFGHHSYQPKSYSGTRVLEARKPEPNTWHWDEFALEPATPLTLIKANERFASPEQPTIHLREPAPDGALVRFSAVGRVEISFDGSEPLFIPPTPSSRLAHGGRENSWFSSYAVPLPAGTRSVTFAFSPDGSYAGPFRAKDFSVWSR